MTATSALNRLLWWKYISVNKKKGIFYTVIESILNYSWEIWTVDYKLNKKNIKYRNGFLEKSCKDIQTTTRKK